MCNLRAGIVTNCRKCKSSVRVHCALRKKAGRKTYVDSKKKAGV